jgi:DNA-directed RNA polymerase subunit H (RpoH/RPB5)
VCELHVAVSFRNSISLSIHRCEAACASATTDQIFPALQIKGAKCSKQIARLRSRPKAHFYGLVELLALLQQHLVKGQKLNDLLVAATTHNPATRFYTQTGTSAGQACRVSESRNRKMGENYQESRHTAFITFQAMSILSIAGKEALFKGYAARNLLLPRIKPSESVPAETPNTIGDNVNTIRKACEDDSIYP